MTRLIAAGLQIVGVVCVSIAGFTVDIGLGFLALGVGAVLFGVALERG